MKHTGNRVECKNILSRRRGTHSRRLQVKALLVWKRTRSTAKRRLERERSNETISYIANEVFQRYSKVCGCVVRQTQGCTFGVDHRRWLNATRWLFLTRRLYGVRFFFFCAAMAIRRGLLGICIYSHLTFVLAMRVRFTLYAFVSCNSPTGVLGVGMMPAEGSSLVPMSFRPE